jgi:hypothetical protein
MNASPSLKAVIAETKAFEFTWQLYDWCLSLKAKLADFLKSGKDWERKPTSVAGVFVLKMPPFKGSPARLAVELNPTDEAGRPTRKRGVLLRSYTELAEYKKLIEDDKLTSLLKSIDSLSPKPVKKEEREPEIIEI